MTKGSSDFWNKFKKSVARIVNPIYYSLPFQLFLTNFKRYHFSLLLWVILLAFFTGGIGKSFGILYLFLDPEYLGAVGFWSFFMMGISLATFIMAYQITSYIISSITYPFLGALPRPFLRFSINNSAIPLFFVVWYVWKILDFQLNKELQTPQDFIFQLLGLFSGISVIFLLSFSYFFKTNKDILKILGLESQPSPINISPLLRRLNVNSDLRFRQYDREFHHDRIDSYLDVDLKFKHVSNRANQNRNIALKVLRQTHINALLIQLVSVIVLLFLGLLRDNEYIQIPAGASVFILFAMLMMLAGALSFWLRGWSLTAFIILLLIYNFAGNFNVIKTRSAGYGLDYDSAPAQYNLTKVKSFASDSLYQADKISTIRILERWKAKNSSANNEKPVMVFINVSGGGLRSALFSLRHLQKANKALNGNLMNSTMLISGASGGMIGATYFRELLMRSATDKSIDPYDTLHLQNISKDILNPVIFSIAANDLFIPLQKFEDGGRTYYKDRGYEFEKTLNSNLNGSLSSRIKDYASAESLAAVPMIVYSPVIINDGRKLFISPLHTSYLNHHHKKDSTGTKTVDGVEFIRYFNKQDAGNLRLLSALRMNSTFPYITPNISLPSSPPMEVLDAGMRDNLGTETSLRFINVFSNWISENVSRIVILQIRDNPDELEISSQIPSSLLEKIFRPLSGFYGNWATYQQYGQQSMYQYVEASLGVPVEQIVFQYIPGQPGDQVSLSWHLTTLEKIKVINSVNHPVNKRSMQRLTDLLGSANDKK